MPHIILLHAIMVQEDNDTSVSLSLQHLIIFHKSIHLKSIKIKFLWESVPLRQVLIDSNCIICMKVNKNFAIKLVAEETVTDIEARVVSCDGGGGALGHPKVYINLVRVNPSPQLNIGTDKSSLYYREEECSTNFHSWSLRIPLSSLIYLCCGFEHK